MRYYKRKTDRGIKDIEALVKAVREIKTENRKMKPVALKYKIDRCSLMRYISKLNEQMTDISTIDDEELSIIMNGIASYGAPAVNILINKNEILYDFDNFFF